MNSAYDWEKRAEKYGPKIEGVLPKSFPRYVNKYLDFWMWTNIKNELLKHRSQKILDEGCGYGRLADKVLRELPGSSVYGVDISKTYVEIFNQSFSPRGKAQVGDIRNLPFKDNYFDTGYMVTTLLYMTTAEDQKKALKETCRVIKKRGNLVVIERNPIGHKIVTLGGLVTAIRGKKNREIESVSFTERKMANLLAKCGFELKEKSGMPFFTILLPFILVSSFFSKNFSLLFVKVARLLDDRFNWLLTPSLYISYSCVKR